MKYFDYNDMNLIPKKGILNSRSDADTTVKFGKHTFNLPVVPANMTSVINQELAIELATNNYFYIMHRFNIDTIEFVKYMHSNDLISSISVGVTDEWFGIITKLKELNLEPDYITIDIAHGHSDLMKNMLKHIKKELPNTFVIAGNISTIKGANFLKRYGADAVKVGIGPGDVCFVDGTEVLTLNGYKKIEDINTKDFVLTHNNEFKEVINTISYKSNEKLLKVNGVICTENHEFYVINKKDKKIINDNNYNDFAYFVKAKNLNIDTQLILSLD